MGFASGPFFIYDLPGSLVIYVFDDFIESLYKFSAMFYHKLLFVTFVRNVRAHKIIGLVLLQKFEKKIKRNKPCIFIF